MRFLLPCLLTGAIMTGVSLQTEGQVMVNKATDTTRTMPVRKPIIKKPKPIRAELSIGLRLNTNGWSIYADKGYVKDNGERDGDNFFDLRLVQVELSEVKHPKETKHTNTYLSTYTNDKPKPFIYGKINNFYTFKIGYGFRKMIAGKPEAKNVSIHWFGVGGLSLGMLKPYYVDAYVPQDNNSGSLTRKSIKYEDDTKFPFLTNELIIGSSGFSKGLGEMKYLPGLHVKTGLHFDFSSRKKTILAIETGVNAEIYSQKIEIMANQDAHPYNFNIFAAFQFGKRW